MRIANEERFLLMSAIQNNTISVWYAPLESINYDESIDTVPSMEEKQQPAMHHQHSAPIIVAQKPKKLPSQAVNQPFGGGADADMTDVTRATYVKVPADRPLGLDMKQFEQQQP